MHAMWSYQPRNLVWLLLSALLSVQALAASQTFTLSVVPQFTPVDIGLRWKPLLERLEAETGYGFQLRLFDRIPKFESDFESGAPDLVYLNPYHMVMAAKSRGYIPLVRGTDQLNGILVVQSNSPFKHLSDLNGKKIAFPAPNAFGASLYMRALLKEKAGIDFSADYVGTHQNVYRHVVIGDAAAGGGIQSSLEKEPSALRTRLRVIYTAPGTASHPIAAHPRLPQSARERISAAFLRIDAEPGGRKLLADVDLDRIVAADYTRDYQPLENLRLDAHAASK